MTPRPTWPPKPNTTSTPTPSQTLTPSQTPTVTDTSTPTLTPTPTLNPYPVASATPTLNPYPVASATPTPTLNPYPVASATPSLTASTTPTSVPAVAIRINAGGPATTVNGTSWLVCSSTSACNGYVLNGSSYSTANTITLAANSAPANQSIYQTGRGTGTSNTSLDFAVPLANGSYTLRLHFADTSKTAAGQRRFDVQAEGVTILDNYDVFQRAGGRNRAIVEEATITVSDGTLNLNLLKDIDNVTISGIEIIGN